MTECELVVEDTEVQVGDHVVEYQYNTRRAPSTWEPISGEVARIVGSRIMTKDGSCLHDIGGMGGVRFKVRRKMQVHCQHPTVNAVANLGPAKKVVPDWPLSCPKCGRASSAVLLFMGYDCKHGCFK